MARRATYINRLAQADPAPTISVDAGDLIGGTGNLFEVKGRYLFETYRKLGVDAMAVGITDLDQGHDYLKKYAAKYRIPLVSCNLYDAETNERFVDPYVIKRVGGKKFLGFEWGGKSVGIFGVFMLIDDVSTMLPKKGDDPALIIRDARISSREVIEELKQKTDFIICLANTGWVNATNLARGVTGIDVMVVGNGANIKPKPFLVNDIALVMPGDLGKQLGILELKMNESFRVEEREGRTQAFEENFADDPVVAEIVDRYRVELNEVGRTYMPTTSELDRVRFVGAEACAECHLSEYEQWMSTPHADAITTLIEAEQAYNPECVKCHVTGYGKFNGFHSYEKTSNMVNVQCEVCHGSGIDHINYVRGEGLSDAIRTRQKAFTLAATEDRCVACHNSEHDQDFFFDTDVKLVDHSRLFEK
ncbi:MAG: hypothetical protein HKN20_03120 [Gemmatimonadetes bacterium]|nr:hypothetical protein [Gemmatimonadota bacterium]